MAETTTTNSRSTVSRTTYLLTGVALLALLGLTVLAAEWKLGTWSVVIALAIAGTKALLILVFFMHLKVSDGLVRLAAATGFVWLAILIGLTLADYASRG